jgi:hypothetical protein
MLIEGGLAARETAEGRAQRQITTWRSLAGGWASDAAFEDEVANLFAARSAGRDVSL